MPLRVVYYARVSTDKDDQLNSLENQQNYFEEMITENKNWVFCGGYIDEGISGTAVKNRDTKEYSFLFHITGDINDDTYTYLYNPKTNSMESTELFSVVENNVIITSKLNPTIGDSENIDKKDNIMTQKK